MLASLAPSFVAEFPGVPAGALIHAIRALGFSGVSETALGAQEVTAACAAELARDPSGLTISSACPTAVEFIRKYHPERLPAVSRLVSPLLAHCKLLQARVRPGGGHRLHRPLHRQEAGGRPEPPAAGRGPHLRRSAALVRGPGHHPGRYGAGGPVRARTRRRGRALPHGRRDDPRDSGRRPAAGELHGVLRPRRLPGSPEGPGRRRPGPVPGAAGLRRRLRQRARAARACGTASKWLRVLDRFPGPAQAPPAPTLDLAARVGPGPGPGRRPRPRGTQHGPCAWSARALRRTSSTAAAAATTTAGPWPRPCWTAGPSTGMCVSYMRKLAMNKANALIRAMPSGGGDRRREPRHRRMQPAVRRDDGTRMRADLRGPPGHGGRLPGQGRPLQRAVPGRPGSRPAAHPQGPAGGRPGAPGDGVPDRVRAHGGRHPPGHHRARGGTGADHPEEPRT